MNSLTLHDCTSTSNRSVNGSPPSLHGVAVSPRNLAPGQRSHSILYVAASAWCASSTITSEGLMSNSCPFVAIRVLEESVLSAWPNLRASVWMLATCTLWA